MKSPYRFRGDAPECWRAILFGEIVRSLDLPVQVREDPSIRLPQTGRWENGLAQVRPALDDTLGATAFAVAWRWVTTEKRDHAWPGLPLIAQKATDQSVKIARMEPMAICGGSIQILEGAGERTWRATFPFHVRSEISVSGAKDHDWSEVDRVADMLAAWLHAEWSAS
jgi:hypothetical protein